MRSIHDEIDARVCPKCFTVFHTLARLKTHDCRQVDDDDDDDDERGEEEQDGNLRTNSKPQQPQNNLKLVDASGTPTSSEVIPALRGDDEKENSPSSSSALPVRQYRLRRADRSARDCHPPPAPRATWMQKKRRRATGSSEVKPGRELMTGRTREAKPRIAEH